MYRGRGQVGYGGGSYGARGVGGPRKYGGRSYGDDRRSLKRGYSVAFVGVRDGILNFPMGSSISPSDVQRWACELAIALADQCPKSELTLIVQDDGTPAENYPFMVEPEMPDENDPDIDNLKFQYQESMKYFNRYMDNRRIERVSAVALIKSKMGQESLARVRETVGGRAAILANDPLALLEQIFLCHSTDYLLETEQNAVMAMRRFHSISQGDSETTANFYIRFKALRNAVSTALDANGDNPEGPIPSEAAQAVMFTIGLNNGYRRYKTSFTDGTNEGGYPLTLDDAYRRALKAAVEVITYRQHRQDFRGIFIAGRGDYTPQFGRGGGGRGGGRGGGKGGNSRGYSGRGGYSNHAQNGNGGNYNNYQQYGGAVNNNQAQNGAVGGGRGYNSGFNNQYQGGRGGGKGRGGVAPRLCYICRSAGHLAAQCPHRDDAVIDEAFADMNAGAENGN